MQQRPAAALPLRWRAESAPSPCARAQTARLVKATAARARTSLTTPTPSSKVRRRLTTTTIARVASVSGESSSAGDGGGGGGGEDTNDPQQAATTPLSPEAPGAAEDAVAPPLPPPPAANKPPRALSRALVDSLTRQPWYLWYMERLARRPTLTKAVTALCGFVIGDLLAQSLSFSHVASSSSSLALDAASSFSLASILSHIDWLRTLRMGAFGFLIDGPIGGAYYAWLDKTIYPQEPTSARAVVLKTVLDQTVYSALGTVAFFTFIRLLETSGDWSAVGPTLQAKFWPTLAANYAIWPLAHLINFRFVPPPLRVAYNQVIAIGWLTWLSLLAHSTKAAATPAAAVAVLAHKAAVAGGGGGAAGASSSGLAGLGGWLQSLVQSLLHV